MRMEGIRQIPPCDVPTTVRSKLDNRTNSCETRGDVFVRRL